MSTNEPTDRPQGQESQPQVEDAQTRRVKTNGSAVSPSPAKYSVELALPRSPWLDLHLRSPLKAAQAPSAVRAQRAADQGAGAAGQGDRLVALMPMSFGQSAEMIWKLVSPGNDIVLALVAAGLIGVAWCVVLCWYVIWGLLIPYRLLRGSGKKPS